MHIHCKHIRRAYRLPLLCSVILLQACASTPTQSERQSTAPAAVSPRIAATLPPDTTPERSFDGPQIVFSPGSAEVPRSAAPVIEEIASKLKADPLVNVMLVGHTEDLGSTEFSVAVAGKCAQAVSKALVKRGARPNQIRLLARGHEKAAKRCTTAACRKKQRRVEIVLSEY